MSGMTGDKKKKAVTDCCCTGSCCCLPVDYSNPLYPDGVLENIPFQIVSPGCAQINGYSNEFVPLDPTSVYVGGCGPCSGYFPIAVGVLPGVKYIDIGGMCMPTPCSIDFCLILTCLAGDESIPGQIDECCSRIRLWIGSSVQQKEDDGSRPNIDFTAVSCISWKKVSAIQCVCNPELSARFPLSLNFDCAKYSAGACAGKVTCCELTCNLSGAEVII